jgi:hypothetical protein
MSITAYLPCFVCGRELPNVMEDCDNQPYEGTVFTTEGHYGSTFWDSFDCEELVLTICDACLRARTGRLGQQKRALPVRCAGMSGFGELPVNRPLVAYTGHPDTDSYEVDVEELGQDPKVRWVPDIAERRKHMEEHSGV